MTLQAMNMLYKKTLISALPLLVILLTSCYHTPYYRARPTYIAYKNEPACALNRAWISGSSMYSLHQMRMRQATQPETQNERIAVAEREIHRAKKQLGNSPQQAATHYLRAAESLWPIVKENLNPPKTGYRGGKKRLIIAHNLYTYAVGQTANLLATSKSIKKNHSSTQLGGQTLTFNTSSADTLHPSFFDVIKPIDTYHYGFVGDYHYSATGLGAATIGYRKRTKDRAKESPTMPPNGFQLPINVIIDYPSPGNPRITLTNLLNTDTTRITGSTRPLSADYSAVIAATMDDQSPLLGLAVALNLKTQAKETGLFSIGPYNPNKIPVIFIHGLISQPSTWTIPSNYLLANKSIRESYQFYYYFYPTGVTPLISGARLRKTLLDFYQKRGHQHPNQLKRTVLIGHSMGGLLSSVQSRIFDKNLWHSIFKETPKNFDKHSGYAHAKTLFTPPTLTPIERTIFISTPHRGSKLADGWIGRIGSSLIKLPQSMLSLNLDETADSMTELGRSLINSKGPANSITRLEPNNPSLMLLAQQPASPRVTFHSIIGDRGRGDTPDSSDGVVPYWSSHTDLAISEKIVPTHHEAHLNSEAHHELERILLLHLKTKKK